MRRFAVGLSLALLAWNNLVHLLPGASAGYVPLNLAATAAVTAAARRSGLSASDLGLRRDRLWAGARWGGAVAAVVAGALAVAWAVPALHPLLDDARVQRLSPGAVAYHALVRIPLGTVLFEEVAFRGALFGALAPTSGRVRAALASSAVFGLWHVRPTLGRSTPTTSPTTQRPAPSRSRRRCSSPPPAGCSSARCGCGAAAPWRRSSPTRRRTRSGSLPPRSRVDPAAPISRYVATASHGGRGLLRTGTTRIGWCASPPGGSP